MSSQNNIVMDISTMFTGLKGDSRQKLDNVAKLFAKTFDKFAKPFGIDIDKNSIRNIEDLEKKFRELGITATQVGKTISLSMKAADGKFLSTSFDYEGGKAGSGKAKFTQGAVVQSTSYLKPTEQLQRNYENLIKARKELASLEEKGYSKDTETWRQAEESAKNYKEQLYATIEALKERYKLSVDIDREEDIISWGDGKGQLETMGRKYQHSMDYSAAKQQDTVALKEQARIQQENTQKVREYVSALEEQWTQENKLAVLRQSKAPQNQIQQQQKIVDMAREHADALKQQVQGTEEYKKIEEQLTYAQEKQNAKQLELNKTTKKSVSLFGNFKETLKQVISAGLSWKIFSAITQSFKQMYTTVIDLDGVLVDLQMVMGSTREEAKELLLEYNNMAQQLGATTEEVASQAVEWQRQGYNAEETNTLIHNSTVLAKVGMLEEAEAQEYLTSAMKGYQVSVEDSIKIVDQLTAIDLDAAVSAGGLAEGMSRTANAAQMAGVEMNELLGYLAVVGETTQKSMSSVGESKIINALRVA